MRAQTPENTSNLTFLIFPPKKKITKNISTNVSFIPISPYNKKLNSKQKKLQSSALKSLSVLSKQTCCPS